MVVVAMQQLRRFTLSWLGCPAKPHASLCALASWLQLAVLLTVLLLGAAGQELLLLLVAVCCPQVLPPCVR